MSKIGFQHAADLCVEIRIRDNPDHLKIQAEGAVVEIRRADGRERIIDDHDLLVQEPFLISVEPDARILKFL